MNIYNENYLEDLSRNDFIELSNINYCLNKKLEITGIKNGIILPPRHIKSKLFNMLGIQESLYGEGGVVDSEGQYVQESAQLAFGMRPRVKGSYAFSRKEVKTVHKKVIYMNYFTHQWGHFLIDTIGRLWYAIFNDTETTIVYTCFRNEHDAITGNYLELLKLMGIEESRLLMVNSVTKFDKIIVPESAILPGKYYTPEYSRIFDTIITNADIKLHNTDNIYCSRAKLKDTIRKEYGCENLIEKTFNDNNYKSVYMEKLSLREQIKTLNSAKNIVLTNGSLAHNLLFVRNNANVIILNKTYRCNTHQFLINEISNAKAIFVDVYISPMPVLYGYGPFIIAMTKEFLNFCQDNNIKISDSEFEAAKKVKSNSLLLRYYKNWLWCYKAYLLRGKSIVEGNSKTEKTYREIRKFYRQQSGI